MLISTTEELRLYSPANAIDHIDTIQGYIASSEKDTLLEKLGTPLYEALVKYYRDLRNSEDGISTFIQSVTKGEDMPPYAQLLTVCQRIITFDALGRAIDIQAVSVNGSGVNISTADDYGKADDKAIQAYKSTCIKETHAAINALLVMLEQWYKEATPTNPENPLVPAPSSPVLGDSVAENEATVPDDSPSGDTPAPDAPASSDSVAEEDPDPSTEKAEIASLWGHSRYFYLAASLAIPSATVLQEYLNIYDSREKFITMLPDLRYIQEDIIAPIIGEDFLDYLIERSRVLDHSALAGSASEDDAKLIQRIIHKLRKAVAHHLEARTMQLKTTDPRREAARNEAVRLTTDLSEYIQIHQQSLPEAAIEALKTSPLCVAATSDASPSGGYTPNFQNNSDDAVMFVTPALPL